MAAELPLRLVENHLTALRRLAYRLVGDPDDAEDAVQETWLLALQSRPSGLDRLRGWLETVLRNVVRKRHRRERRSLRREHAVARSESVQPAVDVLMRQQHLGALIAAIRDLPVDLQECVFLRYFDGLKPRQIAERTGRPVACIYRSIERAKIQLRRALEHRNEDWRKGLALLIGLRPAVTTLAVGGWIVMAKKLVAVGSVLLVVLLSYVAGFWSDADEVSEPTEPRPTADLQASRPDAAVTQREVLDGAEQRRVVPVGREDLEELAPYDFEFEIHARTEEDLPGADVTLLLAPEFHSLNRAQTDKDGVLRVRFKGRVPEMTMVVACPSDSSSGNRLRRVQVKSGETNRAVVRVRGIGLAAGTFYLRYVESPASGRSSGQSSGYRTSVSRGPGTRAPKLRRDPDGLCWFTAGSTIADPVETPERSYTAVTSLSWGEFRVRASVTESTGGKGGERVLRGTVRGATGKPVANALVMIHGKGRIKTNSKGQFELKFRAKDGDRVSVRAGGGNHGLAEFDLEIRDQKEFTWDAQLDRGIEFQGTLVDADAKPLRGWRIEIQPEDGEPWIDGAETDAAGVFAIPNVMDRPYKVRASAPKAVLAALHRGGLHPHGPHVLPVVSPMIPGTFQVAPRGVDGKAVSESDVRLWDDGSGEGRVIRIEKKPQSVAAGNYRLVVGAPGFATKDVAQVRIDGGQLADFGDVELGEPSVLELPGSSGSTTSSGSPSSSETKAADEKTKARPELIHMHAAVPSSIELEKRRRVAVPPGRYRVFQKSREREFEVVPGPNHLPGGAK